MRLLQGFLAALITTTATAGSLGTGSACCSAARTGSCSTPRCRGWATR
ncbi:hypothetical protein [Amycolatopsis sp. RTGN1]|nr:hypothetical protein [Amycolatopsis sp. RTGN1]